MPGKTRDFGSVEAPQTGPVLGGAQLGIAELDAWTRDAICELQSTITAHFPTTTFELTRSQDDPRGPFLLAMAAVDSREEESGHALAQQPSVER